MKIFIKTLLIGGLFFPAAVHAQQIKEDIIKVGRKKENGYIATTGKYGKAEVKDILAERMEKAGLKHHGKKKKFYKYGGVIWPVSGSDKVDILYRVATKKHQTVIYFIVSKGAENYITTETDFNTATNIRNFLAGTDMAIAREQQGTNQEQAKDAATDQEKKQTSLQKTPNARLNKPVNNPQLQAVKSSSTY